MAALSVDGLCFEFDDAWEVAKYDEWIFYKRHFQKIRTAVKAVDLLALAPDRTLYLIEVKDYRQHTRTKPSELHDEVCCKVLDTLAAVLPAKVNARETAENDFAKGALTAVALKVILHLEQPRKHSRLRPRAIDPASVQLKLRQRLRAIDAHPEVHERGRVGLPWVVS